MKERVLVLNADYQAIGVVNAQRAFILVYLRKAEIVEDFPELSLRSATKTFKYPAVIRLYRYVNSPYRKVALTRANIFRRDDNKCVYCGSSQQLTIDHVIPRSAGGSDNWENLVTACRSCNTRKGNRTPEESNMPLLRKPCRPSYIMFLSAGAGNFPSQWHPYIMW
jgi:5-methylcytosine-specific restriction endonuclease McrA